jgi:hypothetical protein
MQIHRLLSGAVTVVVFLAACGDDPSDVSTGSTVVGSTISATLEEWKVQIDADSVGSGDVVFSLTSMTPDPLARDHDQSSRSDG